MIEKQDSGRCWFFSRFGRRRELTSPSAAPTVCTRSVTAELSRYQPLPAIGSRRNSEVEAATATTSSTCDPLRPPPLLRQNTYVVKNPLVVKGPPVKKPRRKFEKRKDWGYPQPVRHTTGGTCFTIPMNESSPIIHGPSMPNDDEKWTRVAQDAGQASANNVWGKDNVRLKNNAQAYWLQC